MTPPPTMPPLLVLDGVEAEAAGDRLAADVLVGGHRVRLVVDFSGRDLGFAAYVDVPWLLELHEPSLHAVVKALRRINEGEPVPLPHDLSDAVRDTDPPNPWQRSAYAESGSQPGSDLLELREVDVSGDEPALVTATMTLDGRLVTVEAEVYAREGTLPATRWVGGTDPSGLTQRQRRSVEGALVRAVRTAHR